MYSVKFDTIRNVLQINLKKVFSEDDAISLNQEIKNNIKKLDKNCNLLTDLTELESIDDKVIQYIKDIMNIINAHGVANIYRVLSNKNKNFGLNIMSHFHYSKKIKTRNFTSLEEANNYLILNTNKKYMLKFRTLIKIIYLKISILFKHSFFRIFLIASGFIALIILRLIIHVFGATLGYLYITLINLSGIWFGIKGGIISASLATLIFITEVNVFSNWYSRDLVLKMIAFRVIVYFFSGILVGLLIEMENRLKNQLKFAVCHDELTGFYNFRFLLTILEKEFHHCLRQNKAFSIAIIDIDNFKAINDNFGHLVGNDVLKSFSKIVKTHLRIDDSIGRYGGDEFIIIFRNSQPEQTKKCIERIQSDFKRIKLTSPNMIDTKGIKYTVSAGISSFNKSLKNVNKLIESADNALYKAKSNNKDCIVISLFD